MIVTYPSDNYVSLNDSYVCPKRYLPMPKRLGHRYLLFVDRHLSTWVKNLSFEHRDLVLGYRYLLSGNRYEHILEQ